MAIHLVEDLSIGDTDERPIVPRSESDEVVKGLVAGRHVLRVHASGQRLDALPLTGQTKPHQIGP
jgi:hypothetical protein